MLQDPLAAVDRHVHDEVKCVCAIVVGIWDVLALVLLREGCGQNDLLSVFIAGGEVFEEVGGFVGHGEDDVEALEVGGLEELGGVLYGDVHFFAGFAHAKIDGPAEVIRREGHAVDEEAVGDASLFGERL